MGLPEVAEVRWFGSAGVSSVVRIHLVPHPRTKARQSKGRALCRCISDELALGGSFGLNLTSILAVSGAVLVPQEVVKVVMVARVFQR